MGDRKGALWPKRNVLVAAVQLVARRMRLKSLTNLRESGVKNAVSVMVAKYTLVDHRLVRTGLANGFWALERKKSDQIW